MLVRRATRYTRDFYMYVAATLSQTLHADKQNYAFLLFQFTYGSHSLIGKYKL